MIYDQLYDDLFLAKLESHQYKAALIMTGAVKGSSTEKLFQVLGIENLHSKRRFRKLCLFYKILQVAREVKSKFPFII